MQKSRYIGRNVMFRGVIAGPTMNRYRGNESWLETKTIQLVKISHFGAKEGSDKNL